MNCNQVLPNYYFTYLNCWNLIKFPTSSKFGFSDYVSFIKKALVLTQRFPLIQRIDIVLIPQHRGFDEHDSGYVNGDVVTSPTHEDWLKTTDEERAAKMRAQVVKMYHFTLFHK